MSKQIDIFNDRNLARHKDPSTSHIAAAELKASGKLGEQCLRVLKLFPHGETARELSVRSDFPESDARCTLTRRLPDLRSKGLVLCQDKRPCKVTGKMCVTWQVTAKGRLWVLLKEREWNDRQN